MDCSMPGFPVHYQLLELTPIPQSQFPYLWSAALHCTHGMAILGDPGADVFLFSAVLGLHCCMGFSLRNGEEA